MITCTCCQGEGTHLVPCDGPCSSPSSWSRGNGCPKCGDDTGYPSGWITVDCEACDGEGKLTEEEAVDYGDNFLCISAIESAEAMAKE